jgi:23S rRNA (guanosine2251-2'-O)-methyltransferase
VSTNEVVVYGRNSVRELIAAGKRVVNEVWVLPVLAKEPWLAGQQLKVVDKQALSRFCGSPDHQGVAARTREYPYASEREVREAPGPIIVLDGVQDVHNLGAVARVAEAAGAAGLVIAGRGSPGVTAAVCKVSAGAVEHLRIARPESLVAFVHDARGGGRLAYGAVEDSGTDFREAGMNRQSIIVVGAEGEGIRPRMREVLDGLVTIPMVGRVSSLNLSVACGILVFATRELPSGGG